MSNSIISRQAMEHQTAKFLQRKEAKQPFPVSCLVRFLADELHVADSDKENQERLEHQAEAILGSEPDYFLSTVKDQMICTPRDTFFNGTVFRVVPSKYELDHGILFPGARFSPFVTPEIFPDDYQVSDNDTGSRIGTAVQRFRYEQFAPAFLLLGRGELIDYLVAESEQNYRFLRSHTQIEKAEFDLTVFDCADFYAAHHFSQGDYLEITVKDWKLGHLLLKFRSGNDAPSVEQQNAWILAFESALLQVCAKESNYQLIQEQLAEAFLFAAENGEDLRQKPFVAMDEYQYRMSEIAIKRDESDWILVPADDLREPGFEYNGRASEQQEETESHSAEEYPDEAQAHSEECECGSHHHHSQEQESGVHVSETTHGIAELNESLRTHTDSGEELVKHLSSENFSASSGAIESIESILAERNSPLDYIEIYSMINDALANGEEQFDSFYARLIDLLGITFSDDGQEAAFLNFLEDNWELCVDYYNPTMDAEKMPLRSRLLDICIQRIDLAKRLVEHFPNEIPKNLAREYKMVHRQVLETLSLLNTDSELQEGEEAEQLELRVGDIEDAWDLVLEHSSDAFIDKYSNPGT